MPDGGKSLAGFQWTCVELLVFELSQALLGIGTDGLPVGIHFDLDGRKTFRSD